jgi:hypothetical protein
MGLINKRRVWVLMVEVVARTITALREAVAEMSLVSVLAILNRTNRLKQRFPVDVTEFELLTTLCENCS